MTNYQLRGLALLVAGVYLSQVVKNDFTRIISSIWIGVQLPDLTIDDTAIQKLLRCLKDKWKNGLEEENN